MFSPAENVTCAAPIDRHEFRMIDRKGTKRPRLHPASQAHRGIPSCGRQATGRDCLLSTTSVNRRGPPPMPRAELGIHGLKARAATGLEKSEKRGVQAARNGPSPPPTPAGGPVAKAEMSTADRLGSRDLRGAGAVGRCVIADSTHPTRLINGVVPVAPAMRHRSQCAPRSPEAPPL